MSHTARKFWTLGLLALALGTARAQIEPTTPCGIAKLKCALNKVKRDLSCEGKAAKRGMQVDTICTAKAQSKFGGSATSCMGKADVKYGASCVANGDDATLGGELVDFVADLKAALYTNPVPIAPNGCAAQQYKCARVLMNGLVKCDVTALKKGGFVDRSCVSTRLAKFAGDGVGCMDKADAKCAAAGVGATGQASAMRDRTLALVDVIECQQTPAGATFDVTTQASVDLCGTTDGTVNPTLACGKTYVGGGNNVFVSNTTTTFAAGQSTHFDIAGGKDRVCPRSAAETGSNRTCSSAGCFFGPPVPMVLGGISNCGVNTFAADAHGEITANAGDFTADILLQSALTITGNAAQPCPKCVAGTCDATAANAGAACTADVPSGESHDCTAAGPVVSYTWDLSRATTGTSSRSDAGGLFCPSQTNAGAFGDTAVKTIAETGDPFGNLHGGPPGTGTLALVFCIPGNGNILLDGTLDLPGPAATSLVLSGSLN